MAITAAMVKELREMSGAGMMDCKKALTATDGDMDKAVEYLRENGLAKAQKKASRIAAEGVCYESSPKTTRRRSLSKSTPRPTSSPRTRSSRIMYIRLLSRP